MEKRNNKFWVPILIGLALAGGIFVGRKMALPNDLIFGIQSNKSASNQKIQDIIDIIDNYYVDSVNSEELLEKTISDMLHQLDPHSNYISAKDMLLAKEQIKGEFSGVGIRFLSLRDTICVINVVKGSPSDAVGVKAGDKILKVDGKTVAGVKIKTDDIMSRLKGKANTKVNVVFLRDGKTLNKTITRGTIPIYSVSAAFMMNKETGFVKIDQFSITTASEFRNAAKQLLASGMKSMILDLRNNSGGVMQSATTIVDEFLPANKVIVSTKGTHLKEQFYKSSRDGILEDVKVVVLINENSASASEIVAGALQDNDRATIVGRRSFGKGLVQEDMVLRDNSSLRLTVARYYTPTGRSIQKPYNGDIEEYYHEEMSRYDKGELFQPDSSLFVDSLKYTTPKGKIVYGGGGIMPDVFVPLDTTGNSWYLTQLRYAMTFQSFAFDFAHGKYEKWKNPQEYAATFNVSDNLMQQFLNYAQKEFKIAIDQKGLRMSKSLIKLFLKAEIARQIWVEDGYYTVVSQDDKEVKAALQQLK